MELIRTVDGIELPAQGEWAILPHRTGSRAARTECRVAGSLSVGVRAEDVRLLLSIDTMENTTLIDACVARADDLGNWLFAGTASRDGVRRTVDVPVAYHGVFRRNGHTSVWLTVDARGAAIGRTVLRQLVVDVSATWPAALRAA